MPKWNCLGTAIVHLTLAYLARGSTGMSFFMCHHCELPFGVAGPWNPIQHRVCGGVWASGGGHRGLRLSTGSVEWAVSKGRGVVFPHVLQCVGVAASVSVLSVSVFFWGFFSHQADWQHSTSMTMKSERKKECMTTKLCMAIPWNYFLKGRLSA